MALDDDYRAARLLELEDAILALRRRFVWALVGYIILAIGLVVAFLVAVHTQGNLEDTQRGTIELVRKGQVFDCQARKGALRYALESGGAPESAIQAGLDRFGHCKKIERQYEELLKEVGE